MTTADDFARHRPALVRLAYRMLGSVADAEDVVQETFVRWQAAGSPDLDSPKAWFTRTCTRICLDWLKSARWQREEYVGEWLPEPFPVEVDDRQELDETLSMALLLTVQRLRPSERAAFLLHDVFGYSFPEVAEILGLEAANCRQLASRARRRLRSEQGEEPSDAATVERLSGAFFQAIDSGDLAGLRSVLANDVVLRTDGGGKAAAVHYPLLGVDAVSRFFHRIFGPLDARPAIDTRAVWFNGAPGMLILESGEPVSAFHFQVVDDRIAAIFVQRNPEKLRRFEVGSVH